MRAKGVAVTAEAVAVRDVEPRVMEAAAMAKAVAVTAVEEAAAVMVERLAVEGTVEGSRPGSCHRPLWPDCRN